MHFHHCPDCYKTWSCKFDCTIEPDLEDKGKQFGSYCRCKSCDKQIYYQNILATNDDEKYKYKDFWEAYNGFVKVRKKNLHPM